MADPIIARAVHVMFKKTEGWRPHWFFAFDANVRRWEFGHPLASAATHKF